MEVIRQKKTFVAREYCKVINVFNFLRSIMSATRLLDVVKPNYDATAHDLLRTGVSTLT
jgi:hypothetical protein